MLKRKEYEGIKTQCLYAERSCYRPLIPRKPKRAGKYERLLKALLKQICVDDWGDGSFDISATGSHGFFELTKKQTRELIAIKERMEKKGKK